jgi:lipopolysaccharide/colanic/teichoic acid biosynthesis glycosyltransferase
MRADTADGLASGSGEVTTADARLTPIGGWIRAWRVDELPQLWHVLVGEMSLVGPRPDLPENLQFYASNQFLRFAMPQGCTAWTFTRGAFDNDWSKRQSINVEYVQQWSFGLDVNIMVNSALVLLQQKATSPTTNATPQAETPK